MSALRSLLVLSCVAGALGACGSPSTAREASAPRDALSAPQRPWTKSFTARAVLTARSVRIVGPRGLLEHLVLTQDPDNHVRVDTTDAAGLHMSARQREGGDGAPIRAQLDNLVIAADLSLEALEGVAVEQVSIEAEGDVYWCDVASGREQRTARLRIDGENAP